MATVWAAFKDAFQWKNEPKKTGWSHSFKFSSLSDLVEQMRRAPLLGGKVTKLAIVAHGDKPGEVQLDRPLNPESAKTFRQDFAQLDPFLTTYARLIFYSCIAGKYEDGSRLLNMISGEFLKRRHVIGFEVFGGVGLGTSSHFAGEISAVEFPPPSPIVDMPAGPRSKSTVLSEYSWYAKWSLDGRIIHLPKFQQGLPGYVDRIVYGITAVNDAIRKHSPYVKYVYVESDAVRAKVSAADMTTVRGKVAKKTHVELTALAGTNKHEGVVMAWSEMTQRYRCADPQCPGHQNPWEFCEAFARRFPNGPLQ